MKKLIHIGMVLLMLTMLFTLASCRNDSLVGSWRLTDMTGWGVWGEQRAARDAVVSGDGSAIYRFYRDGRISVTVTERFGSTAVVWGNWSRNDGVLRTWAGINSSNYIYHLSGSRLTLTDMALDVTFHFERGR